MKLNFPKLSLYLIFILSFQITNAQNLQTIKGAISDKQSQQTIPGATIQIVESNPIKITRTDVNGKYKLTDVAPGRYSLSGS